jgi:hypothetical protein
MKSILSLTFTAIINVLPAMLHAQANIQKDNFSISYGIFSGMQISDALSGGFSGSVTSYTVETGQTGSVFLTYRYFLSIRNAIGLTIGTQTISGTFYRGISGNPEEVDMFTLRNNTIAAEYEWVYYNGNGIRWYTLIGAGTSIYNRKDNFVNNIPRGYYQVGPANGVKFNFQYTPTAITFGPKLSIFAFFIELGLGYKGIFNFGLNYKFGQTKRTKEITPKI